MDLLKKAAIICMIITLLIMLIGSALNDIIGTKSSIRCVHNYADSSEGTKGNVINSCCTHYDSFHPYGAGCNEPYKKTHHTLAKALTYLDSDELEEPIVTPMDIMLEFIFLSFMLTAFLFPCMVLFRAIKVFTSSTAAK